MLCLILRHLSFNRSVNCSKGTKHSAVKALQAHKFCLSYVQCAENIETSGFYTICFVVCSFQEFFFFSGVTLDH